MDDPLKYVQSEILRDWVWSYFLNGFCVNLIRPLVVLVPVLIIFFKVGRAMGLPQLFRRESLYARFFIGVGVGVLVWQAVVAGYLFEEFATNYTVDRPPFCERQPYSPDHPWHSDRGDYDIPDKATGDAVRYRYPPAAVTSILQYGWRVAVGAIVCGAGVTLFVLLVRWVVGRVERLRHPPNGTPQGADPPEAKATTAEMKKVNAEKAEVKATVRRQVRKLPEAASIALGLLVGLAMMAGIAWVLLPGEQPLQNPWTGQAGGPVEAVRDWVRWPVKWLGERGVALAGYGRSSGRSTVWDRLEERRTNMAAENTVFSADEVRAKGVDDARKLYARYYPVYGLFGVGFAFVLAATVLWLTPLFRRGFSPAAGLLFLLHLAVFGQTLFDYFLPFPHLAYLLLALLVLLFARKYKLHHPNVLNAGEPLRDLATHYDRVQKEYERRQEEARRRAAAQAANSRGVLAALPTTVAAPPAGKRLLFTHDISGWDPARKKPLVLVCASGGGSRAAAWTMKVLTELERRVEERYRQTKHAPPHHAFPYHVRMITGASGGIIGAAYYVSTLEGPDATGHPPDARYAPDTGLVDQLNATVRGDFLTPVVHALVSRDLPGLISPRFAPYLGEYDRGRALEWVWEKTLVGGLTQTFDHLLPGERAGWRPSLVFSPMMVEDGRQLIVSNLDLLDIIHNRGLGFDPTTGAELLSREAVEFFRLFPDATDFRVGTAARMSGSFPYVLPAVPLPTEPRRRVVDAGYYDNYGVGLAASWLFNNLAWVEEHASRVAVVQIRDSLSADDRLMTRPTDPTLHPLGLDLAGEWLTTPPAGLDQARVAANTFRNDNLLHLLHQRFEQLNRERAAKGQPPLPFVTPAFELPAGGDVSLSYTLTVAEGDLIDACLPGAKDHPPTGDRPKDNPLLDKALTEAVDRLEGEVAKFVTWFTA